MKSGYTAVLWFLIIVNQQRHSGITAAPLGSQCTENINCTDTVPDSKCNANDVCECSLGFFGSNSGSKCLAVQCGPPHIVNGDVASTGTAYQGTATYTCTIGYSLDGDGTRNCQANGNWSGATPTCNACDSDHWGDNCANTFHCNSTNTNSRSSIDGCVCKPGWTDTNCDLDIDECEENTHDCPPNSYCNNTRGGWTCTCHAGYDTHIGGCTARVGAKCTRVHQQCDGLQNSVCANTTSTCMCADGYYAEFDSNECIQATVGANCSQLVQLCSALNNSACNNVTTTCTCAKGYHGQTGAITCTPAIVGADCSVSPELCNIIPQGVCDNPTSTCKCIRGHTSSTDRTTCTDIDECSANTAPCIQKCTNTDGSYTCSCNLGYAGSGNNCTPCDCNHWGDNCTNLFTCDHPNTASTSPITGCVCKPGWTGTDCDLDINECKEDTHDCPPNSHCSNTRVGWTCPCYVGYGAKNGECPACSNQTYGDECTNDCDCAVDNTMSSVQSCDHVTGTCLCDPGWNGTRCDVDIDECLANTHTCTGPNEGCHNTHGWYECSCERGYRYNDTTCIKETTNVIPPGATRNESFTNVPMFLKLNTTLARVNLSLSVTYAKYKLELESKIKATYQKRLPGSQLDVIVYDIRSGSLLVNYTLVMPLNAISAITLVNTDLASGNLTVDVFGEMTVVVSMAVGDGAVTTGTDALSSTNICKMFVLTDGPCQSREHCVMSTNNEPVCQVAKTDDNFQLIVGLGVGIPLSLITVLVIAVLFIAYFMQKSRPPSTTTNTDRDTSDQSQFVEVMPTRVGPGVHSIYPFYWARGDDFSSIPSDPTLQQGRYLYYGAYGGPPRSKTSWELYSSRSVPARKFQRDRPKFQQSRSYDMEPRL